MKKFRVYDSISKKMFDYDSIKNNKFSDFDLEHYTLMQFIGINDENGIEIYEGDYLADYYPVDEEDESLGMLCDLLPVVWCGKTLQWCVDASFKKDGSFLTSLVEYFGKNLKVKGNIFENKK